MSAYLQMGFNSEILIREDGLDGFNGIILSPVNRAEAEIAANMQMFREKGDFDIIFDPQLYCPGFDRGQLPNHSYYPKDLDTADPSSDGWWQKIIDNLVEEADRLQVDAVCSPAILPKKSTPEYYTRIVETHSMLSDVLQGSEIQPVMTVCVTLQELEKPDDAMRVASIVSARNPKSIYLVLESDVEPRREISDSNLFPLMVLISALQRGGCNVLVSHCSSDVILMKAAGAAHCASGNFFNLRRFTRSRFGKEEDEGGRQIAYWFEHNLMAFLRRADIARLSPKGFIGGGDSNNNFSRQILQQFNDEPKKAWVALGWRQYLAWFVATEQKLSNDDALNTVNNWLKDAEARWIQIEMEDILMDEPRNDGSWIRPWRQILSDYRKFGI